MTWYHDLGRDMIGDRDPTLYMWRAAVIVITVIMILILTYVFWKKQKQKSEYSSSLSKTENLSWLPSSQVKTNIHTRVEEQVIPISEYYG